LPGGGHEDGQSAAGRDEQQGARDDPADAVAVHQRGGEGGRQPVQQHVDGDGHGDGAVRPAELPVQRVDEHAGRGTEAGGADECDEGDRRHPPGAVDARGAAGDLLLRAGAGVGIGVRRTDRLCHALQPVGDRAAARVARRP
jgi:hypothetical protein